MIENLGYITILCVTQLVALYPCRYRWLPQVVGKKG